jgi:hypothetical protein
MKGPLLGLRDGQWQVPVDRVRHRIRASLVHRQRLIERAAAETSRARCAGDVVSASRFVDSGVALRIRVRQRTRISLAEMLRTYHWTR